MELADLALKIGRMEAQIEALREASMRKRGGQKTPWTQLCTMALIGATSIMGIISPDKAAIFADARRVDR